MVVELQMIISNEKDPYLVELAMKNEKLVQKILAGNKGPVADPKTRLIMVQQKNKMKKNLRGFNQYMKVKGRSMQTKD
jgi:hypothetical protein